MTVEAGAQFAVIQFVSTGPRHHDDVDAGERLLMFAKCLPRKPF